MIRSTRGSFFRGLLLGLFLCLLALGGLYLAGFHFMRMSGAPSPSAQVEAKPLCWISSKNPEYVKFEPGKDQEGNELIPVYPTKPEEAVPDGKKVKLWVSPMDPKYVRDKPGKDYMGHGLVPLAGMAGPPERSEERRVGKECRSRWSPYH